MGLDRVDTINIVDGAITGVKVANNAINIAQLCAPLTGSMLCLSGQTLCVSNGHICTNCLVCANFGDFSCICANTFVCGNNVCGGVVAASSYLVTGGSTTATNGAIWCAGTCLVYRAGGVNYCIIGIT